MNVTDVDDKIILRARREHFFAQYAAQHPQVTAEVAAFVREAVAKEIASCTAKIEETNKDAEKSESERVGEVRLLEKRVETASQLLQPASAHLFADGAPSKPLLEGARDAVAVALDARLKESVGNLDTRPFASRYELEFLQDMETLGVRMPDVLTRVSEYVPQIIAYVQKIIANGYAYEANGSVYFDTAKYLTDGHHEYGKLAPSKVGNARAQEDADGALSAAAAKTDKKDPSDFVLWKKSKPGEPVWESPWGLGRPGWHIECSAMASEVLGQSLDIHGGGQDLYFPHHENEIAQCEAYFHDVGCKQWVNYFFHSGHLHIDGLKMAKSLKNFITIRQAMQPPHSYTPRQLRLFFVTRAWNKVVNFDRKAMEEVFATERTLDTFFASVASVARSSDSQALRQAWTAEDAELSERVAATSAAVHAAFCDNFDTRAAVAALVALAKHTNQYLESAPVKKAFVLSKAAQTATRTLRVLGLVPDGDAVGWTAGSGGGGGAGEGALVGAFYNFRQEVRKIAKNKNADASAALLALTDELRDNVLPPLGLKFDDSDLGWKRVDAQKAMQERAERRRLELGKLEKRLAAAEQDLAVLEKGILPPASVLGDRAEFGSFDESGYPLTMADGKEIPKPRQKTLKKAWSAQETAHKKFEAKAKGNPEALLAEARQKVEELREAVRAFKAD